MGGYLLQRKMTMPCGIRLLMFRIEVMKLDKFSQAIHLTRFDVHGVMIDEIDNLNQLSKDLPGS